MDKSVVDNALLSNFCTKYSYKTSGNIGLKRRRRRKEGLGGHKPPTSPLCMNHIDYIRISTMVVWTFSSPTFCTKCMYFYFLFCDISDFSNTLLHFQLGFEYLVHNMPLD